MKIDPGRNFGERECPSCACRVPANSNHCPICQYEFPSELAGRKNFRTVVAVILLFLFALGILYAFR